MRLLFLYLLSYGIFESQSLAVPSRIAKDVATHKSDSFEEVEFPLKARPDVPKVFYPETVRLVLSGHPDISTTRSPETQSAYVAWQEKTSKRGRSNHEQLREQLGWPEHWETAAPAFLDKGSLQDERISKLIPNDFPYQTPDGVDDLVVWSRASLVNKESFKPKKGESWPSEDYNDPERVSALLEYIDRNYLYGYAGPRDVEHDRNLNLGQMLHPGKKPYKASNGQTITQKEGREAFKWAGRHFNAYLEDVVLTEYEEVVWVRNPDFRKGVKLEHVHVIGPRKKEKRSGAKAISSGQHLEDPVITKHVEHTPSSELPRVDYRIGVLLENF
ncbi:uncharacterized protein MELLADRAFT_124139 [Melampsora larici-populina 98AG31]|uniref:Secreted protein n=1 Tax=Melampsora larici-populina (strain 98AG31 / pathotype 3-4-7) TaxID=747676 RepID=F4S297_MELLP|nr:uncharacterized protein MELLADRAFT_124139 [Melampsora larici-populina 98AG31]EGG01137.1 secreted protein [Melampsora larici-populina 98AG31]